MLADTTTSVIAHAIQLAVSPAFPLLGIVSMIALLALIGGLRCFLREAWRATQTVPSHDRTVSETSMKRRSVLAHPTQSNSSKKWLQRPSFVRIQLFI